MGQKLLQYDVIDRLGEGARSKIYAVTDPRTRNLYALKHVIRKNEKDARFIEQMQQEFEVSKHLSHEVLRKSYSLKITKSITTLFRPSEAFLVMELVDGKPLDQNLPPTLLERLEIFLQVAQGLRAMHQAGYVHCDIKPINILRSDSGKIKIIDFGQSAKSGTIKARIQGTPDYIAPEQVVRKPVTAQTDIFNLGATMYWAVTGRTIPTLYNVSKAGDNSLLSHDLIESPQKLNPEVPIPLSSLIMECINTQPSKRPQGMDTVIHRLEISKHVLLKQLGKLPAASIE